MLVYASRDMVERYNKVLAGYVARDVSFPDVIDNAIRHICHRIKEEGRAVEKKEFNYMKRAQTHFLKVDNPPAKGTRVFFETDWKGKITIYDVTTPEEREAHAQHLKGRLSAITRGKVLYDKNHIPHVRLEKTVRELARKQDII